MLNSTDFLAEAPMRLPGARWTLLLAVQAACLGTEPADSEPLLEDLPRPLSAAEQTLITAGNEFSFDLFREATRQLPADSNAFLSPFSASMALGMVLNGAGGETFDAMRTALRFGSAPLPDINQGYQDLLGLLAGLSRTTEIQVANSVWSAQGFPIRPEFVTAVRTWFDAEARALDFRSPGSVDVINRWVSEKTRNRIPHLLSEINPEEVAFLINAVYFKARWREAFDRDLTRPALFHGADGRSREVPMMRWDAPRATLVGSGAGYQAATLLYGNGAFAMTVILPEPGSSPAAVLAGFDATAWAQLRASESEREVAVQLPRFTMDDSRLLGPDLTALGMGIAFDPGRADFYGIADVRPERLFISRVIQKTFVEVNEEGTEAAAATGVGVGVTSVPPSFIVDRPFLFLLHERLTGTVLFIGQINRLGN